MKARNIGPGAVKELKEDSTLTRIGFITSGPTYLHVKEAFPDAPVVELGLTCPPAMGLVRTVMLGAISDYLPFSAEILKRTILDSFRARKPKLVEINERAFEAGREAQAAA